VKLTVVQSVASGHAVNALPELVKNCSHIMSYIHTTSSLFLMAGIQCHSISLVLQSRILNSYINHFHLVEDGVVQEDGYVYIIILTSPVFVDVVAVALNKSMPVSFVTLVSHVTQLI